MKKKERRKKTVILSSRVIYGLIKRKEKPQLLIQIHKVKHAHSFVNHLQREKQNTEEIKTHIFTTLFTNTYALGKDQKHP